MKVGQQVTFVGGDGAQQLATVTALVDHGPSLFWSLGLKVGELELTAVPHEKDRAEGGPFWCIGEPGQAAPATRSGETVGPARRVRSSR